MVSRGFIRLGATATEKERHFFWVTMAQQSGRQETQASITCKKVVLLAHRVTVPQSSQNQCD